MYSSRVADCWQSCLCLKLLSTIGDTGVRVNKGHHHHFSDKKSTARHRSRPLTIDFHFDRCLDDPMKVAGKRRLHAGSSFLFLLLRVLRLGRETFSISLNEQFLFYINILLYLIHCYLGSGSNDLDRMLYLDKV